jgi:hypothetical protein
LSPFGIATVSPTARDPERKGFLPEWQHRRCAVAIGDGKKACT